MFTLSCYVGISSLDSCFQIPACSRERIFVHAGWHAPMLRGRISYLTADAAMVVLVLASNGGADAAGADSRVVVGSIRCCRQWALRYTPYHVFLGPTINAWPAPTTHSRRIQ